MLKTLVPDFAKQVLDQLARALAKLGVTARVTQLRQGQAHSFRTLKVTLDDLDAGTVRRALSKAEREALRKRWRYGVN